MLFKFSQIKFLSHFLLVMATVSTLVASPLAALNVLADENNLEQRINTQIDEDLRKVIVRIEARERSICKKPAAEMGCKGTDELQEVQNKPNPRISNGSGTIIAQEKGTSKRFKYTVLTAAHNFYNNGINKFKSGENDSLRIERKVILITHDDKEYELQEDNNELQKDKNVVALRNDSKYGLDLAVVTFESDVEYPVATLAPLPAETSVNVRINQPVNVTGWPNEKVKEGEPVLWHNSGIIRPHEIYDYLGKTKKGYVMGYNAETAEGVSGGPVFDEQGRLIGVHGQGAAAPQSANSPSSFKESNSSIGETVSGGIPINTFTDQLPGSNSMPENKERNTLFDLLSTNLINLIKLEESIPNPSRNENIANSPSQSIDTYFKQAAQHWKNALAALNNSPGAGCVAECREEAEKALAQYDEALKIINNEPFRVRARALVFRGIVHQLLGNSSKKESDWEEASQIVKKEGEPLDYVWLGNTLYLWGYTQKAEEFWDQAVNIANRDDSVDVYLEIGKFLIQHDRRAEGREYWNRLINGLPENSVVRRKIAENYAYFAKPHLGYKDFAYGKVALEQAQEAVNINPNAYSYYDLARIQADLGDLEAAKASLEQAANDCGESICGTLIEDKRQEIGIATPASESNPPSVSEFNQPQPQPESEIATGPTYFCNDASRQTMRRTQSLINWESKEFGWQYQPEDRCIYVSNRLESYETQGLLTQVARITHGVMNDYRVLCIATDETAANARNCTGGQLIVTLGSINRISVQEAEAALAEFKAALNDPNSADLPLDNIKGVKGVSNPK